MSKSILVIHPNPDVRQDIFDLLANSGFRLTERSELSLRDFGSPDLALIEWHALNPAPESLRLLKQNATERGPRIIVLANRTAYSDAIKALEYGADDCIGVPVQRDELLVRANACLERPQTTVTEDRLSAGSIVLDRRVHSVSVADHDVELSPTEFRLLAFFLENEGRVFSRGELLSRVWLSDARTNQRTVDVHVRRLRQRLEPHSCAKMIQTVRGFGYRLRCEK
jgi:two-component system phosphate regulon response regulator PhoB